MEKYQAREIVRYCLIAQKTVPEISQELRRHDCSLKYLSLACMISECIQERNNVRANEHYAT